MSNVKSFLFQGESTVDGTKQEIKYTKCISTWLDESGTILPDKVAKEAELLHQSLLKAKSQ